MKSIKIVLMTVIIYVGLIFLSTGVLATNTGIAENETTRLRKKASTDSSIVTLISMNEKVEILSEEGNWYKVKYISNGKTYTGYVRKDMLKVDKKDSKKEEVKKEENKTEEPVKEEKNDNTEKTEETTTEIKEITEGNTVKTKNTLEIRILPLITSSKTEKINKDTDVTVTEMIGNWCFVETEKQSGWIMKSQLENTVTSTEAPKTENKNEENKAEDKTSTETENKKLYVKTETVNLRKKASSNSDILEQLSEGEKVTQIEKTNSTWSKVKVNGMTGYIASEYLTSKKPSTTSRGSSTAREEKEEQEKKEAEKVETKKEETKTETEKKTETKKEETKTETKKKTVTSNSTSKSSGNKADKIVSTAKKYLGYRYVSGGSSPKTGFDCSGFTSYVYKVNGYSLNRVSSAQASNGKKVSKSNLQPGDLVLFKGYSGSSIGHVGIYIGGNKFIHAANSRKGVITTSLSESYYAARYVTARRIIN